MSGPAHRLHVAEPPTAYLNRPPLVADASIIAAALFDEDARIEAVALLRGRALHAPHVLDYEIANVGLKKLRREHVAGETVIAALRTYGQLPIERHTIDAEAVAVIAQRYGLTAHDAAYLCVAAELGAPLATFDEQLATAARAHLAAERED